MRQEIGEKNLGEIEENTRAEMDIKYIDLQEQLDIVIGICHK